MKTSKNQRGKICNEGCDEFNGPRGDFYKNMFAKCLAGRLGTADEVANVAELLISNKRCVYSRVQRAKHLQSIHKYIFQDVYEWAGKIRKVDIAKGNMFCNVKFIESQAEEIFGKLKEKNYLQGLDEREISVCLVYYFSEINALHPFREGNGRSQREFIRTLALHAGYVINFGNVSGEEMLKVSEDSFLCNYRRMEQLFA